MAKTKLATNITDNEKNVIIETINEYSLFNAYDTEIIEIIAKRIGRRIGNNTYYLLKKEAKEKQLIATQWLDVYTKSGIIDHYWKRIKEVELAQKYIIKEFMSEANKPEQGEKDQPKKNKYLMEKLAGRIADNATKLCDMGMSPPVLAYLQSLMPQNIIEYNQMMQETKDKAKAMLTIKDNVTIVNVESDTTTTNNKSNNGNNNVPISSKDEPTAIFPPVDKTVNNNPNGAAPGKVTDTPDEQRVF